MGEVIFNQDENIDKITIKKSYEKLSEENVELSNKLDYITKEELIQAIKILTNEINKINNLEQVEEGYVSIKFTYDNLKLRI